MTAGSQHQISTAER